jgi:hypothetical protein
VRTVAALYVDEFGPYVSMPGVDAWDVSRDATDYHGPHPVVAHPPCGPWSRMSHFSKHQDPFCAPTAVLQVQAHGGVLEHPADSKLFAHEGLPMPGELPDRFGGRTYDLRQCDFGHVCSKPTWIYVVGGDHAWIVSQLRARLGRGVATHSVCNGRGMAGGKKRATALQARLTPPAFAEFLVELARMSRPLDPSLTTQPIIT